MNTIQRHYTEHYDEQARFDHRYNQVEFLTTMRYIEKYLPPLSADAEAAPHILEVGAGTGRYSRAIADRGYAVDALELTAHNIEVFRTHLTPAQNITLAQGDALDLSRYADGTFDMTLVLGPLYHLFTEADKQQCIREALRVTKPGGVIFAAWCIIEMTIYETIFMRRRFEIDKLIADGKLDPHTFATTSTPDDIFELVRKEDIDRLMSAFPVTRLHYVATTLTARILREALAEMNEDEFALYMRHHFAICERADMVGMTSHSLDIFRK